MNSIKLFLYDLRNSFYNPDYYKDLKKRTFGSALINFIYLGVISGIGIVLLLLFSVFPAGTHSNIKEFVAEAYPEELVITIENGQASTNLSGPYIIPIGDEALFENSDIVNLLVLDTTEGISIDDLEKYKTMALLSSDRLVINSSASGDRSELQIIELSDIDDVVINESFILNLVDRLKPLYYALILLIPILIIVFMTSVLVISYLVLTLAAALIALIVSKIADLNYSYRDAYVVSMFAMIPVIIYDLITDIIRAGNLISIGALVFTAVIYLNLKKREVKSNEAL